jgi:hypothetical protein
MLNLQTKNSDLNDKQQVFRKTFLRMFDQPSSERRLHRITSSYLNQR